MFILIILYNFAKDFVMTNICSHLQDDNKTKEELLENIIIEKTTYKDAYQIIQILSNCFRY